MMFLKIEPLINKFKFVLLLNTLLFPFFNISHAAANSDSNTTTPVTAAMAEKEINEYPFGLLLLGEKAPFTNTAFVVDKKKRMLSVYQQKNSKFYFVSDFPTDMGKKNGEKTKKNDFKTPVGIYFLLKALAPPEIPFDLYGSYAFTTDYPNIFDQREDKTGSGIWLHAVPDTVPLTRGSRGCVVVRNEVIQKLKPYVQLGETPILIEDEVKLLSQEDYKKQKQFFLDQIENWRVAWESQNIDEYMKYYDDTFMIDNMNYKAWYKHKKKLAKLYTFIKVNFTSPTILHNSNQVVLRFVQNYKSNLHKDIGVKTIHARYDERKGFKIIREEWRPFDSNEGVQTPPLSTEEKSVIQMGENQSPPPTK